MYTIPAVVDVTKKELESLLGKELISTVDTDRIDYLNNYHYFLRNEELNLEILFCYSVQSGSTNSDSLTCTITKPFNATMDFDFTNVYAGGLCRAFLRDKLKAHFDLDGLHVFTLEAVIREGDLVVPLMNKTNVPTLLVTDSEDRVNGSVTAVSLEGVEYLLFRDEMRKPTREEKKRFARRLLSVVGVKKKEEGIANA
jgi:hypothetical protein